MQNIHRGFFSALLTLFFAIPAYASATIPDVGMTEGIRPVERKEVVFDRAGDFLMSPLIRTDRLFNAVIVRSDHSAEGLEADFYPRGNGVWEPADVHDDGYGFQAILFTEPSELVRFRVPAKDPNTEVRLSLEFIFADPGSEDVPGDGVGGSGLIAGTEFASAGLRLISRNEWGADENLRYWSPETQELFEAKVSSGSYIDPCESVNGKYLEETEITKTIRSGPLGEALVWPISYAKNIEKFVIHHTDSELRDLTGDRRMDGRDYKAMIQAIYYFHAITRGWGDIGYNYLIDPLGNIYEGRAGGRNVVGAHAQCYNNGSVGIALIGNYEKNRVPEPALLSLISLIALESRQYRIDPMGSSIFRGKALPNVIGHKDVRPTSCPGKYLYAALSRIRERASLALRGGSFTENNLSDQNLDYNAVSYSEVPAIDLLPNQRRKVTIRFKNTGKKTWDHNTWLHVALNNKEHARVVPILEDKNFVAADLQEDSVPPGRVGTFEVELEGGYFGAQYEFEIAPVVNGRYKVSRAAIFLPVNVIPPEFSYEVVRKDLPSGILFQGQQLQASIILKNTGNTKWFNYGDMPIRLGTEALRDHRSDLVPGKSSRLAHLLESEVEPGETGTFIFNLEIPRNKTGFVRERFTPVIENVRWLEDKGMFFEFTVKKPKHAARIVKKPIVQSMLPGEMKHFELTLENRGDLEWRPDNMEIMMLGTGIKLFKKNMIPEETIRPKKQGTFSFWAQAPYQEGQHRIFLRSKINKSTISGGTSRFIIDVDPPRLRAKLLGKDDRSISMSPGEIIELEVQYQNMGNAVWRNKGTNAIHLAPTRPQDRLSPFYMEDEWVNKFRAASMVEEEVKPGETGTFRFKIKAEDRGRFREYFQLVIENVGWIGGSYARWDIAVTGDRVSNSSSSARNEDALNNSQQAAIITRARADVRSDTAGSSSAPASSDAPETFIPDCPQCETPFRLRLSYEDDLSEVTADRDYYVTDGNNKILFELRAGTVVSLKREGASVRASVGEYSEDSGVIRIVPKNGGIVEIVSYENRPAWNATLNDNRFRGVLEVRSIEGKTAFINELPIEDYLKGVAEVSNTAPREKQKVLAVLARTYARFYLDPANRKFPGMPYDGSDDPNIFQKYLGYGYELRSPNFASAVTGTQGEVVTYGGQLVKTPYFNQSDGRTRSAKEVWGWDNTPYLQSVPDPFCEGMTLLGHGVGMSGCGSEGAAKAGKTYEEIIKYYYRGVEIERR